MDFPIDVPADEPMLVFKDCAPDYLKANFLKWCEIGLSEIGPTRKLEKETIEYVQTEFVGLINAFYCTAASMAEDITDAQSRAYLQQYLVNYYKPDKPHKDILPPPLFCRTFFKGISFTSARSILWFLMGVVIAKKELYDLQIAPLNIFNLFERYEAILAYSDDWYLKLKDYERPKKKRKKH
jgi:hypothetical protein